MRNALSLFMTMYLVVVCDVAISISDGVRSSVGLVLLILFICHLAMILFRLLILCDWKYFKMM